MLLGLQHIFAACRDGWHVVPGTGTMTANPLGSLGCGVNWALLACPTDARSDWDLGCLEAGSKPRAPCSAVGRPLPSESAAEIGIAYSL